VRGGPGGRASAADLLDGIRRAGRREVVLVPNDAASLAVADAAAASARGTGHRVAVVPARATVQALAAVAVHDPDRDFHDDLVAMSAAAASTRHGAVTVAARDAMTTGGPCRAGDVLGVSAGDFVLVGDDLADVAVEVIGRTLQGGGELVTLVRGTQSDPSLADDVAGRVCRAHPGVEVVVHDGGQPRYPLLFGVE
jgi:dihydroxyacetone kinase-like predicted kinase